MQCSIPDGWGHFGGIDWQYVCVWANLSNFRPVDHSLRVTIELYVQLYTHTHTQSFCWDQPPLFTQTPMATLMHTSTNTHHTHTHFYCILNTKSDIGTIVQCMHVLVLCLYLCVCVCVCVCECKNIGAYTGGLLYGSMSHKVRAPLSLSGSNIFQSCRVGLGGGGRLTLTR